jgi:hypothetical protein
MAVRLSTFDPQTVDAPHPEPDALWRIVDRLGNCFGEFDSREEARSAFEDGVRVRASWVNDSRIVAPGTAPDLDELASIARPRLSQTRRQTLVMP